MRNSWLLIYVYLLLLPVVWGEIKSWHANDTVWEKLEAVTMEIDPGVYSNPVRMRDEYRYYLWGQYAHASRSERPAVLKEMSQHVAHKAYVDFMVDTIALILSKSQKDPAVLRSIGDGDPSIDQCVQSTLNIFGKYCGSLSQEELVSNFPCIKNMCNYAVEMIAIEDAMLVACGVDHIEPSVIDAENPEIDVIPAPVRGSSDFCERVSVRGISRMNLQSYAKAYHLLLDPLLIPHQSLDNIRICFHRNASRGLCECEDDDWQPIQNMLQGSILSPFEHVYVDIRFSGGISGSVTITLDEVSQGRWRYLFLVAGIGSLFVSPFVGEAIFGEPISKWVDKLVRSAVHIFAIACIYQSSIDVRMALTAVGFSLTTYYTIRSILRLRKG